MSDLEFKSSTRAGHALGCEIFITVLDEDMPLARRAIALAFEQIQRVERMMSIYNPESELCRLNEAGGLNKADPYLVRVLDESRGISERSGGAFDVTVQPLWTLYAEARQSGQLPSDEALATARKKIGWQRVSVSSDEIRMDPGMVITLNGIAQGFAADRAAEGMRGLGIRHALINAGEISTIGPKPDGSPWLVGIQHPREPDAYIAVAQLEGRCMTTSGDYETKFTDDFVYNHIFEPWSGRSPRALASVSIVAPTATEADGLSTAVFVLGPEKGMELILASTDVDAFLVRKDGTTLMTENFPLAPVREHV